mmetsp:Transcript_106748/g.148786  ORF Transcript_106748/g.148786 Transcript_106748/m.148786 type:complete len:102 (+) Transcript_106748:2-307(+)
MDQYQEKVRKSSSSNEESGSSAANKKVQMAEGAIIVKYPSEEGHNSPAKGRKKSSDNIKVKTMLEGNFGSKTQKENNESEEKASSPTDINTKSDQDFPKLM